MLNELSAVKVRVVLLSLSPAPFGLGLGEQGADASSLSTGRELFACLTSSALCFRTFNDILTASSLRPVDF